MNVYVLVMNPDTRTIRKKIMAHYLFSAKLSVPLKLSKVLSSNRRLQHKLKKQSLVVKVSNKSSAAESFLNKFQLYVSFVKPFSE